MNQFFHRIVALILVPCLAAIDVQPVHPVYPVRPGINGFNGHNGPTDVLPFTSQALAPRDAMAQNAPGNLASNVSHGAERALAESAAVMDWERSDGIMTEDLKGTPIYSYFSGLNGGPLARYDVAVDFEPQKGEITLQQFKEAISHAREDSFLCVRFRVREPARSKVCYTLIIDHPNEIVARCDLLHYDMGAEDHSFLLKVDRYAQAVHLDLLGLKDPQLRGRGLFLNSLPAFVHALYVRFGELPITAEVHHPTGARLMESTFQAVAKYIERVSIFERVYTSRTPDLNLIVSFLSDCGVISAATRQSLEEAVSKDTRDDFLEALKSPWITSSEVISGRKTPWQLFLQELYKVINPAEDAIVLTMLGRIPASPPPAGPAADIPKTMKSRALPVPGRQLWPALGVTMLAAVISTTGAILVHLAVPAWLSFIGLGAVGLWAAFVITVVDHMRWNRKPHDVPLNWTEVTILNLLFTAFWIFVGAWMVGQWGTAIAGLGGLYVVGGLGANLIDIGIEGGVRNSLPIPLKMAIFLDQKGAKRLPPDPKIVKASPGDYLQLIGLGMGSLLLGGRILINAGRHLAPETIAPVVLYAIYGVVVYMNLGKFLLLLMNQDNAPPTAIAAPGMDPQIQRHTKRVLFSVAVILASIIPVAWILYALAGYFAPTEIFLGVGLSFGLLAGFTIAESISSLINSNLSGWVPSDAQIHQEALLFNNRLVEVGNNLEPDASATEIPPAVSFIPVQVFALRSFREHRNELNDWSILSAPVAVLLALWDIATTRAVTYPDGNIAFVTWPGQSKGMTIADLWHEWDHRSAYLGLIKEDYASAVEILRLVEMQSAPDYDSPVKEKFRIARFMERGRAAIPWFKNRHVRLGRKAMRQVLERDDLSQSDLDPQLAAILDYAAAEWVGDVGGWDWIYNHWPFNYAVENYLRDFRVGGEALELLKTFPDAEDPQSPAWLFMKAMHTGLPASESYARIRGLLRMRVLLPAGPAAKSTEKQTKGMKPVFQGIHANLPPGFKWLIWLLASPLAEEFFRRLPLHHESPLEFALKHNRVFDTEANDSIEATRGHYLSLQYLGEITDAAFESAQDMLTLPVPILGFIIRVTVGWLAGWLAASWVHGRFNWDRHFQTPLKPGFKQAMGMKGSGKTAPPNRVREIENLLAELFPDPKIRQLGTSVLGDFLLFQPRLQAAARRFLVLLIRSRDNIGGIQSQYLEDLLDWLLVGGRVPYYWLGQPEAVPEAANDCVYDHWPDEFLALMVRCRIHSFELDDALTLYEKELTESKGMPVDKKSFGRQLDALRVSRSYSDRKGIQRSFHLPQHPELLIPLAVHAQDPLEIEIDRAQGIVYFRMNHQNIPEALSVLSVQPYVYFVALRRSGPRALITDHQAFAYTSRDIAKHDRDLDTFLRQLPWLCQQLLESRFHEVVNVLWEQGASPLQSMEMPSTGFIAQRWMLLGIPARTAFSNYTQLPIHFGFELVNRHYLEPGNPDQGVWVWTKSLDNLSEPPAGPAVPETSSGGAEDEGVKGANETTPAGAPLRSLSQSPRPTSEPAAPDEKLPMQGNSDALNDLPRQSF